MTNSRKRKLTVVISNYVLAWENSRNFGTPPLVSPRSDVWARNKCRNSILVTCHHPNLASASGWLSIRYTQSETVARHQYGISSLEPQASFPGKSNGGTAKCRLFSKANFVFSGRAGDWVIVVWNCTMGLFWGRFSFWVARETGSKFVTKNSPTEPGVGPRFFLGGCTTKEWRNWLVT